MAEVLQGLPLENLFIINVSNLQNVLTQVAAAVRQNAAEIQAIQDLFASLQDDHSNKKQSDKLAILDLRQEINQVRELLKTLVTGSDVHELRFNMEQKHKSLEEGLSKVKEDAGVALEDIQGLRGEVIKQESALGGCRRDIDKLRQEYNGSSSNLDYKLENLDNKFSSFVNNTSALVTKDELKGKVKDEVQSLRREIEEMHKATAEVHGQLQKKLTDVLEGDFEEVKQAIPELRESVQELMKNTTDSTADVKTIKVFIEHQTKIVKELQDSVETKADKNSLEDLAKYAVNTRSKMADTLQSSISQQQREILKASNPLLHENGNTNVISGHAPDSPVAISSPTASGRPTTPQKRPLTPLAFSTVSPSRETYTGGNPEFPTTTNFATFMMADISGPQLSTQPNTQISAQLKSNGDDGQYMSIVADTVDTPAPELMSREIKETQRQCVDLRKDLSDLASLVEVLTSEMKRMKDKDSNSEVWQALDAHTQQLSHLLHTKADLSNVENALSSREPRDQIKILNPNATQDEMDSLRQAVNQKATREELRKMRRVLQKELEKAIHDNLALGMVGGEPPSGETAALATRMHFRCLACDRLIWKININKQGQSEKPNESKFMPNPNYDIAPNIAWRRSQVKDLVSNKHNHPTTVNALVNNLAPSTSSHSHSHSHHNKSPGKTRERDRAVTPTLPPISVATQPRPSPGDDPSEST